MRKFLTLMLAALCFAACTKSNDKMSKSENDTWDKVFPLSDKVNHQKVSFETQYGFTLVADMYMPADVQRDNVQEFGSVCDEDGGAGVCRFGF